MKEETKIGGYRIVLERPAWLCDICSKPTYSDNIKHRCESASHSLGFVEIIAIENLTKKEVQRLKAFLKKIRN